MSTTAVQKQIPQTAYAKPSALAKMASRLEVDPTKLHSTLKSTVFQKASDDELLALVVVANEYGLNPFLKEIYAFPAKGGGIVPIVSVDGWNKMLIRQPDFDGIEFDFADGEDGKPISCTATIHIKNRSHPVKVTEYFDECKRNTEPWNTMPRRMLRNRTLCQASRMAFGFSGVMNDDEAQNVIDVEATKIPAELSPKIITAPPTSTPQQELEALIVNEGFTFEQFRDYVAVSQLVQDADSLADYTEISTADATRLLRAKVGLVKNLKEIAAKAQA
jgi:phage recombination protein Bet